jgi:hypothetical protein
LRHSDVLPGRLPLGCGSQRIGRHNRCSGCRCESEVARTHGPAVNFGGLGRTTEVVVLRSKPRVFCLRRDPLRIGHLDNSNLGCLPPRSPSGVRSGPAKVGHRDEVPIARQAARAGTADSPARPTHGECGDSGSALRRAQLLGYCLAPPFEHLHELRVIAVAFGNSFGGGVPARHETFDGFVIASEPGLGRRQSAQFLVSPVIPPLGLRAVRLPDAAQEVVDRGRTPVELLGGWF